MPKPDTQSDWKHAVTNTLKLIEQDRPGVTITVVHPPPDGARCTMCKHWGKIEEFKDPDPDQTSYVCPKCPMDESGLEFYWDGETLQKWQEEVLAEVIDKARSQSHDDRMMHDQLPDVQETPQAPPERTPIKLTAFQRTAVFNSREFNNFLDLMAKTAIEAITGDNDDLEGALEDVCHDLLVEFGIADLDNIANNDEAFNKAMADLDDVQNEVLHLAFLRVGPMLIQQLRALGRTR